MCPEPRGRRGPASRRTDYGQRGARTTSRAVPRQLCTWPSVVASSAGALLRSASSRADALLSLALVGRGGALDLGRCPSRSVAGPRLRLPLDLVRLALHALRTVTHVSPFRIPGLPLMSPVSTYGKREEARRRFAPPPAVIP